MLIQKPLFTKKSTALNKQGKYVFLVSPSANKVEIKKAIEKYYNVVVTSVNTANSLGSLVQRYIGKERVSGKKNDTKQAIITLRKGHVIDLNQAFNS